MRAILNVSLPQQMIQAIQENVSNGKFSSKSEFVRHLIRDWQEDQILKDVRQSRREFAAGKGKLLKSFKDLG